MFLNILTYVEILDLGKLGLPTCLNDIYVPWDSLYVAQVEIDKANLQLYNLVGSLVILLYSIHLLG